MDDPSIQSLLQEFADGRTDLVFDLIEAGVPASLEDPDGVSLIRHCAYYGDVSAIRFLLDRGATIDSLGKNLELSGASFHGHWRLCRFLLDQGADVNYRQPDTGETVLHSALAKTDRIAYDRVLRVLLAGGANPNVKTNEGVETDAFMRDCRTKGETPLHRAAAFGSGDTIRLLLDAGATIDARDMHGDTPLSWASWYGRPTPILRQLCYGRFRIHPENRDMRANLLGDPHQ